MYSMVGLAQSESGVGEGVRKTGRIASRGDLGSLTMDVETHEACLRLRREVVAENRRKWLFQALCTWLVIILLRHAWTGFVELRVSIGRLLLDGLWAACAFLAIHSLRETVRHWRGTIAARRPERPLSLKEVRYFRRLKAWSPLIPGGEPRAYKIETVAALLVVVGVAATSFGLWLGIEPVIPLGAAIAVSGIDLASKWLLPPSYLLLSASEDRTVAYQDILNGAAYPLTVTSLLDLTKDRGRVFYDQQFLFHTARVPEGVDWIDFVRAWATRVPRIVLDAQGSSENLLEEITLIFRERLSFKTCFILDDRGPSLLELLRQNNVDPDSATCVGFDKLSLLQAVAHASTQSRLVDVAAPPTSHDTA